MTWGPNGSAISLIFPMKKTNLSCLPPPPLADLHAAERTRAPQRRPCSSIAAAVKLTFARHRSPLPLAAGVARHRRRDLPPPPPSLSLPLLSAPERAAAGKSSITSAAPPPGSRPPPPPPCAAAGKPSTTQRSGGLSISFSLRRASFFPTFILLRIHITYPSSHPPAVTD